MLKKSLKLLKAEDPKQYAKLANQGLLLGYPVSIKGNKNRPDNGVGYHSTIKYFDKDKDHPHVVHGLARHLPLNPPDAKNTQIKFDTFKDRFGNDVNAIILHGNSADKLKEHNAKFAYLGFPSKFEWTPHISVDKDTWNNLKNSGAKTAHEAGISFGNAELKSGLKTLKTYHHEADTTEPKVPDESDFTAKVAASKVGKSENVHGSKVLMKPFVSEAQRRWGHTTAGKQALGGSAGVHEWDEATKGKKLPEKVGKNLEKGALKNAGIALGMAGALAGASPSTSTSSSNIPAQVQHKSNYDHSKMLRALASVESTNGENVNHKPTSSGTAYGKWALMPHTIQDTIKGHKDLKAKYGKALALKGDQLNRFMQDNKGLEDIIADRHLSHIEHNFKNNPESIAFAWNQGISGTKNAKNKGVNISEHPYVKKFKAAYSKEK